MEALRRDWRTADLSPRQSAILTFCERMTLTPGELSEADIDGLREEGLRDDEVLAVVMLAGFFQLATSMADALGVELDAHLTRGTAEYEEFMTD
ncbi:MAG: hypothetical protein KAJ67_10805 [Gemmatimonadetes bacterium]|nr:hypothetical protein [Gemmatimonadota bacterium]